MKIKILFLFKKISICFTYFSETLLAQETSLKSWNSKFIRKVFLLTALFLFLLLVKVRALVTINKHNLSVPMELLPHYPYTHMTHTCAVMWVMLNYVVLWILFNFMNRYIYNRAGESALVELKMSNHSIGGVCGKTTCSAGVCIIPSYILRLNSKLNVPSFTNRPTYTIYTCRTI